MQHWGKSASEREIAEAAAALPTKLDHAELIRRHLTNFRNRAFPGDPNVLIDIVRRASDSPGDWDDWKFPDGKRITIAALLALKNVRDSSVRQFALGLMRNPKLRSWSTGLLINNLEQGDYERIGDYIGGPLSDDEVHSTALDLPPMVTVHPSPDAVPVLLALYERNPCSECRHKIVSTLIDLNALPARMARECRYEANIDTRSLVLALDAPVP